jgi:hypothetical protein
MSSHARTVVGLLAGLLVCTSVTSTEAAPRVLLDDASDTASVQTTVVQHPEETAAIDAAVKQVESEPVVNGLAYDQNTWGRGFDMSNVQAMPVDTPGYSCAGYVCAPSHPAPPYRPCTCSIS